MTKETILIVSREDLIPRLKDKAFNEVTPYDFGNPKGFDFNVTDAFKECALMVFKGNEGEGLRILKDRYDLIQVNNDLIDALDDIIHIRHDFDTANFREALTIATEALNKLKK